MAHLTITCNDYLRTPRYSWTFHNDAGGSFSNSGMQPSIRKAARHYAAQHPSQLNVTVMVIHVEGYDSYDKAFLRIEPATTLRQLIA